MRERVRKNKQNFLTDFEGSFCDAKVSAGGRIERPGEDGQLSNIGARAAQELHISMLRYLRLSCNPAVP